jgi:hypothetical protein
VSLPAKPWRLPPPDDAVPLGVLRARRDVRLAIARQDTRLGDTLAAWRNLHEAARLDRLIHERESKG